MLTNWQKYTLEPLEGLLARIADVVPNGSVDFSK